jgi:hypothetical protein
MESDAERCAEYEKFKKIDAAFRAGDLDALRAAVDDPAVVPNGPMPLTIGSCLEYAIYHSPLRWRLRAPARGGSATTQETAEVCPLRTTASVIIRGSAAR